MLLWHFRYISAKVYFTCISQFPSLSLLLKLVYCLSSQLTTLHNFLKVNNEPLCMHILHLKLNWVGQSPYPPPPQPPTPCWFSLNNLETVKAATLAFCNISLKTSESNFVSLTPPSFQILGKTQTRILPRVTPEPVMILTWNLD